MKQVPFGSLPVLASQLALGCSRLSPLSGSTSFASACDVVNRSLDRGITFFDTADTYGAGWSERWLGRALGGNRDRVLIATKCGRPATMSGKVLERLRRYDRLRLFPPSDLARLFSATRIESAIEGSLRRLGTEYVDVLLLHSPPAEVLADGSWVETLSRLRDRGLARFFGISAVAPEDAAKVILDYGVDCVEFELNPCTAARARATLDLAGRHGTAVIARQAFGSGRLLDSVGSRLNTTATTEGRRMIASALLQFVVELPNVSVTVVGMSSVEHVDRNTTLPPPDAAFVSHVADVARQLCE